MENNTDIKKLLGKRIKECRKEKGLTQEKLAEMIGLGVRNVSKIECGDNFVTAETLSKIILALKIEPAELFDFSHHDDTKKLKEELLNAIQGDKVDIRLLYRIYKSIK
ncbi:MAG: helix-turn-helix domain-containing protein [Candidatus Gastranaerophilales bacterium]|nr:helix-turn-helix domain-containing protein [Candidatus Gastranaerophilales bacterium]